MGIALVIMLWFCTFVTAAWGGAAQQCTVCHPHHYAERGTCVSCHRGNPASPRKNSAHVGLRGGTSVAYAVAKESRATGERLLENYACRRCHVIAGRGNRLARSLDEAAQHTSSAELTGAVRTPAYYMPDFRLTHAEVSLLVGALYAGAELQRPATVPPVKVHFTDTAGQRQDVFSRRCGSCHRLLSERFGGVGSGTVAGNLSGLLSPFYPVSLANGERWSPRNLNLWLKNPRQLRRWAVMPPVQLSGAEQAELLELLMITATE